MSQLSASRLPDADRWYLLGGMPWKPLKAGKAPQVGVTEAVCDRAGFRAVGEEVAVGCLDVHSARALPSQEVRHYRLPGGTQLPDVLDVIANGEDVGGRQSLGHHTIYSTCDIPYDLFANQVLGAIHRTACSQVSAEAPEVPTTRRGR